MTVPAALRPSAGAGVPLSTLAAQVGAVPADGPDRPGVLPELHITGVTLRAQDVQPGDLFAALPGASTHGARFYRDALESGAVAVLTDAAGLAAMADAICSTSSYCSTAAAPRSTTMLISAIFVPSSSRTCYAAFSCSAASASCR